MKHHLHHSGMECCIRIGNLVESSWFPLQLETKLLPPNHNRFGFGKPMDQLEWTYHPMKATESASKSRFFIS